MTTPLLTSHSGAKTDHQPANSTTHHSHPWARQQHRAATTHNHHTSRSTVVVQWLVLKVSTHHHISPSRPSLTPRPRSPQPSTKLGRSLSTSHEPDAVSILRNARIAAVLSRPAKCGWLRLRPLAQSKYCRRLSASSHAGHAARYAEYAELWWSTRRLSVLRSCP